MNPRHEQDQEEATPFREEEQSPTPQVEEHHNISTITLILAVLLGVAISAVGASVIFTTQDNKHLEEVFTLKEAVSRLETKIVLQDERLIAITDSLSSLTQLVHKLPEKINPVQAEPLPPNLSLPTTKPVHIKPQQRKGASYNHKSSNYPFWSNCVN